MRNDVRNRLIDAACERELVYYGDLMREFRLGRGRHIASVLCEISLFERENARPCLPALVVLKGTDRPAVPCWRAEDGAWEKQRDAVYKHWSLFTGAELERLRIG